MSRSRIILLGAAALAVMIILVFFGFTPRSQKGPSPNAALDKPLFPPSYSSPISIPGIPVSGSAFLPPPSPISLDGRPSKRKEPPTFQEGPIITLEDIAKIIAAPPSGEDAVGRPPASEPLLLPAVSDSEIAIDASGAATTLDYLTYFNTHAIDGGLVFDNKKFEKVLKDENGVMLFAPELVSKALADNNFAGVHDSLLVQKEFANAEITYLKSIKVAEAVVPLHKKNIAFEKLLVVLIDKAFAVEAGTMPKSDLQDFFSKFVAAATGAHQELLLQSGAVSFHSGGRALSFSFYSGESWFDRLLNDIGFTTPAYAQFKPVFGGRISPPIFCPCSAGFWVTVGPPKPASLFVPVAVIANPLLFHLWRQLRPGVWWLGINLPLVIPCLSGLACAPIGGGSLYLIGGTSLF